MKTNWNNILTIVVVILAVFGAYKLFTVYKKDIAIIESNTVAIDSLQNKIFLLDKSILTAKEDNQKLEGEKYLLDEKLKRLKNTYNDAANKKNDIVYYPYSDSAKYLIITEYFTRNKVPLSYSR